MTEKDLNSSQVAGRPVDYRRLEEIAGRSVRILFRGEDHWISNAKCQRNIGLLIICIGDLETKPTLLDPLSKSVTQFCRLLASDDYVRFYKIRSVAELTAIWARDHAAYSHIVLIAHGNGSGLRFAADGWQTAAQLEPVLAIPGVVPKYFVNLACHPRLFRHFHRAHHRSITPTPWAAYSFAMPEAAVMFLFVPLWLFFVPTPGWVMVVWLNFQIIRNAMGHAGFEFFPGWWLNSPLTRWINTTVHHDLHHSGGFNSNFGLYFTWWDKGMGTEHPRYHEKFREVTGRTQATVAMASSEVTA